MFGKGLITGLGVTLKHFFGKKSTFCYPEEKLPMTEHFRGGHLELEYKKCIACTLCAQACPNQALKLKVIVDANKTLFVGVYLSDGTLSLLRSLRGGLSYESLVMGQGICHLNLA